MHAHSVLFIDVASVFATMLRRIVFDTSQGDEAWIARLRSNGFSEAEITQVFDHLRDIKSSENTEGFEYTGTDVGISVASAVVQQLYPNTWVSVEVVPNDIAATGGS